MSSIDAELFSFLILLAGSLLMPVLSGRVRVPSPVLLIVFGLLMGPKFLGWLQVDNVVGFLSEVGIVVLMFLAGMEIDFNRLTKGGFGKVFLLLVACLFMFVLAFLASGWMGLSPLFGLALGATSIGLPLAVLKESGQLRSRLGQSVILLGSIGEIVTVLGMTLFFLINRHGISLDLLLGMIKLLLVLLAAGFTLRSLMALAWWRPQIFSRLVEKNDGTEIGVRAALFLMMVFTMLSLLAGIEAIVGAFLAGAMNAFVLRDQKVLEEKLSAVGHGLFVPIFFVVVGVRFDPGLLNIHNLLLAFQLVAVAGLIKCIPSLILKSQSLSVRDSFSVGLLLAAPLTLVVAISSVGFQLKMIGPEERTTMLLLAILGGVLFPIGFHWTKRRESESSVRQNVAKSSATS